MAHFKSKKKILLIVEGGTEKDFFERLFKVFGLSFELVVVASDLYSLYSKMEQYDLACDVKDVLAELVTSGTVKEVLKSKFAYTYLVFDSDLQNKTPAQRGTDIPIEPSAEDDLLKVKKMAEYFTNETDPSIGRLYINYPMMESFRYCDSFNDTAFLTEFIPISMMKGFKKAASKKKLAGHYIAEYTKTNFKNLIRSNVKKLNTVSKTAFEGMPSYEIYQVVSKGASIAEKQSEMVRSKRMLSVINTSLFLLLDHYGNKNAFYDDLCSDAEEGAVDDNAQTP